MSAQLRGFWVVNHKIHQWAEVKVLRREVNSFELLLSEVKLTEVKVEIKAEVGVGVE